MSTKEKSRLKRYSHLKNGIVRVEKGVTLDEAIGKVRKGGYILLPYSETLGVKEVTSIE